MKKLIIATMTLSALVMSGCSADTHTEKTLPHNIWDTITENISNIGQGIASNFTVECNASDLTPEQIQEFTEETIRARIFYMHVPAEGVQAPQEQPMVNATETNDEMDDLLKTPTQEPETTENIIASTENINNSEKDADSQTNNINISQENESVVEESSVLEEQPPEKDVNQSESTTEKKTETKPKSDTTKDPVVEETKLVDNQNSVVEDVKPECKEEEKEPEEQKTQEDDSISSAPSDCIEKNEPTNPPDSETSEPEKVEETARPEVQTESKQEEPPKEPVINFVNADEYYYVSASALNFRQGPGTSYEVVTTLSTNTKVHVIGKGDNGWNKIDLNGKICYASAKYLSKNQVVIKEPEPVQSQPKESVQEEMARRGSLGRLSISSCGVNVALFSANLSNLSHGQAVVDRSDSAAYYTDTIDYWGYVLVADHVHQGFSGIKKAVVGSTIATFDFGTYQKSAVCVDRFIGYNGYNGAGGLYTTSGAEIGDRGDICMYTCNSDGTVTITFWNYC